MSRDDLKLEYITEKDRPLVADFLKRTFAVEEPITVYLKVAENPPSLEALAKFLTGGVKENLSFVVKVDGQLAGVCINTIHTKNMPHEEITDPIFGKIATFLGYAYEEAAVFDKFPDVDKFVYMDGVAVDKAFAGKGIGTFMVNEARDLARKRGIKLMRVDCTSHFSARASEKLGMKCVYELKYADYKENGVQVFNPGPPHTGIKVYVQRLDD